MKIRNIILMLWDWKIPYIQMLAPFFIMIAALYWNLMDELFQYIQTTDYFYVNLILIFSQHFICLKYISIFLIIPLLWFFTVHFIFNKDSVLNHGNIYHDHSYFSYFVCSKFLGYKKCNLKNTPIPTQFQLIMNDTFKEFIYDEGIHEAPKNEKMPAVRYENIDNIACCINIVLSDTYLIEKKQLPPDVLNLYTIYIERHGVRSSHVRYASEKFVKTVLDTVRNFNPCVEEINIFATLNTKNCYNIVKEVFCTGGRDNIKHIYVYQQNASGARLFINRVKIF